MAKRPQDYKTTGDQGKTNGVTVRPRMYIYIHTLTPSIDDSETVLNVGPLVLLCLVNVG